MTTPRAVPAVPTVQVDDPIVRVTEWRFAPGAATGWHRHEYPYVVVPLVTGRLASTGPDGAVTTADLVQGRDELPQATDRAKLWPDLRPRGQQCPDAAGSPAGVGPDTDCAGKGTENAI